MNDQRTLDLVVVKPPALDGAAGEPAGELIQLGTRSARVTALDRALEAANGFNPHDIPWNHLGLICALMDDDGFSAYELWTETYGACDGATRKMLQEVCDLVSPRHSYDWYRGGPDGMPSISFNDYTAGGVSTNALFLAVYLRDCHKIYEGWEKRERWREAREYVEQRMKDGWLMRQIDQGLYNIRLRGKRIFWAMSEVRRWRQNEVKRLIERRNKRT